MHWRTAISDITDKKEIIRGHKLVDLIGKRTFTEAIWLVILGKLPRPKEQKMFDALLVSAIEHGIGTASAMTTRIVASTRTPINAALASGLLAMGPAHGGAVGDAARMLSQAVHKRERADALVSRYLAEKKRIPGFGHRVLKRDHRAEKLITIATKLKVSGRHLKLMLAIGEALHAQLLRGKTKAGKNLPLNVD